MGAKAMIDQQTATKYINILHAALRDLHTAYPDQFIELRIKEIEPCGWQCYIEFTERGVKLGSESFYINPPEPSS
jgi:hypothetical protein